jgi:ribosomal protein L32
MTWVLIVWCAIIIVWLIAGAGTVSGDIQHCLRQGVLTRQECRSAADAGAGIGAGIILVIGFFGFVFFSLIWFMTRPRGRDCPACGNLVKRGHTVCPTCGHDFAQAGRGVAATT